jgi:CubicO group peptidase (beta-lactamase class C family)
MNKIIIKTLIGILFLVSLSTCGKEDLDINNVADFEEFIEDEMYFQEIPTMSILIFKEGVILYESYNGKSNIAQGLALEENHLFMLASVSKVITATALLQLYEDGLFELDDNINDYLSFDVNVPNYSNNITFRMLLTHTSGIADGPAMDDQYYYGEGSPIALSYFIENYLLPGGVYYDAFDNYYDFAPGSAYEYSNIGNALIGVLVEEISGIEFNSYCKQNIFNPLGMTNTFWRLDEIYQPIVTPYNLQGNQLQALQNYTFTDYPNGGLRSTGRDLFKFLSAFVFRRTIKLLSTTSAKHN